MGRGELWKDAVNRTPKGPVLLKGACPSRLSQVSKSQVSWEQELDNCLALRAPTSGQMLTER